MGDIMRPVPFQELIERIFSEYRNHGTIFGISKDNFYKTGKNSIKVFGQKCATPLGPAAGPHTQLAQNIISSYLVGGRFIELKTVQIMDYLGEKKMIAKPCIDARDEGHNVEWSTEYTLPKAYDEYVKAWFALHLIQTAFTGKKSNPDFIFNMSVGYNLEGIKQPKMQTYINSMIDASKNPVFKQYKKELEAICNDPSFLDGTDLEGNKKALKGLADKISANISPSVTVSTMHGCPPVEIEAICTYMLKEKKLNTFVKLNPTLLGYDEVRKILDSIGFEYVGLKRETFEHDLQYDDAVAMLHRLVDLAGKKNLGFGVKLTNTLGNVNDGSVLPGEEKYMSGRALLPISTTVAARLSKEFNGKLPVSYSGGANAFSVKDIFDTGIRPITLATDMLKPGGYARLKKMAEILETSKKWSKKTIDAEAVEKLSKKARKASYSQKAFRGDNKAKVNGSLPMFDCYVSPCMEACPIHQNIPDYISLLGQGQYAEALAVIYEDNALPNITCTICDHQCQNHCARMDYEGPVQIRQMKKIAVEKGTKGYLKYYWEKPGEPSDVKAAVVGAGPSGLAAAYFLSRAGFDTTVFEKEKNAGGVVANIIPNFRIDPKVVMADVKHVEANGAKFKYGVKKNTVKVDALKKAGYDFVFYAVGSEKDNEVKVSGAKAKVLGSLEFLEGFKAKSVKLGKHVVVTGGGNTAMDCARAALKCKGVEDVSIVYRRSEKEMPADPDEFELAKKEGIQFFFLSNPKAFKDGRLVCTKMTLGEPDASGRRRPIETDETFKLDCDNLITAVGEHADTNAITWFGIECNEKGWPVVNPVTKETTTENVYAIGDMSSGPSTVVRCIASARSAVEDAIVKVLGPDDDCSCGGHCDCECEGDCHGDCKDDCKDDCHCTGNCSCNCEEAEYEISPEEEAAYIEAEDAFYKDIQYRKTHINTRASKICSDFEKFVKQESKRCMDCTYFCNKCVDVCPNRANVAIDMRSSEYSDDPFQILHIDAFCNECGNCVAFCNHNGKPYRDKFTLFSRLDDFKDSSNSGFIVDGETISVRLENKIYKCRMNEKGKLVGRVPEVVKDLIEQVFLSYSYLLTRVDE